MQVSAQDGCQSQSQEWEGRKNSTASSMFQSLFFIAKMLMEYGADAHAVDNDGWTALHLACCGKKLEVTKLLIENGANVNANTKDGRTPLHLACENGRWKMVQFLLRRGANVNAKTANGDSPLLVASKLNHPVVVYCLVRQYPWLVSEPLE